MAKEMKPLLGGPQPGTDGIVGEGGTLSKVSGMTMTQIPASTKMNALTPRQQFEIPSNPKARLGAKPKKPIGGKHA